MRGCFPNPFPVAHRSVERAPSSAKTGIKDLPVELTQQIFRELSYDSVAESAKNLRAAQLTNRGMYNSMLGDTSLNKHYRVMAEMLSSLRELSDGDVTGAMLGLMPPKTRQALISTTIELAFDDVRARRIAQMISGMPCLEKQQGKALVKAALSQKYEPYKLQAIKALGGLLGHVSPAKKQKLVDFAHTANIETSKAQAIAGLGHGLEHLDTVQKHMLVSTARSLESEEHRALAIAGLGVGLQYLDAEQCQELFAATLLLGEQQDKAVAVAGLGAGLDCFERLQRNELVTIALGMTNEPARSDSIAGLGVGLKHLDPDERQLLLDAAIAFPGEYERAKAIAGLCVGMAHLDTRQHASLLQATKALRNEQWRADTIFSLRSASKHLSTEHNRELISRTEALIDDALRAGHQARGPRSIARMIVGLGAGVTDLKPSLQQRLRIAAADLPSDEYKAPAVMALVEGYHDTWSRG